MNLSNPLSQLEHIARQLASSPEPSIDKNVLIQITNALSSLKTGAQHLEREVQELKNRAR